MFLGACVKWKSPEYVTHGLWSGCLHVGGVCTKCLWSWGTSPVGLGHENVCLQRRCLHTTSVPKVGYCSWGEPSPHVALYRGFDPQRCTSELRSHIVLKVCLKSTTHYFIFCLTATGSGDDIQCINENEIFLVFTFYIWKIYYPLFKIWINNPENNPEEVITFWKHFCSEL